MWFNWDQRTRFEKIMSCMTGLVIVISLLDWFYSWLAPLLLGLLALWIPLSTFQMIQFHIASRRAMKRAQSSIAPMRVLERGGSLSDLSPEQQEELQISRARWKLQD